MLGEETNWVKANQQQAGKDLNEGEAHQHYYRLVLCTNQKERKDAL